MSGLTEGRDPRGVVTLTLNRPERHNAFDGDIVTALTAAFAGLPAGGNARALVLASTGPSFSAGADIGWMRAKAEASAAENEADAAGVLRMLHALDRLPVPTVAVVQGDAFGGAVGLLACIDVVIAAETAKFAVSEVRLGLSPTAIGPFVRRAIGTRQARRYFVTGERMSARRALEIGLAHEVVPRHELAATRDRILAALLLGGPAAQAEAKAIALRREEDENPALARQVAARRATAEAREGMAAFLERRCPVWAATSDQDRRGDA